MGSACCVAARDTALSNESGNGESQRNTLCSPPGRLRWDNYRRVLAEMENPACQSCERMSATVRMEMKDGIGSERGNISDRSSTLENIGTPISQKSPSHEGISTNYMSPSGKHVLWYLSCFRLLSMLIFMYASFPAFPLITN